MSIQTKTKSSAGELSARQQFKAIFDACPIPDNEILANLGLFINRQTFSRFMFMHEMYQRIIDVHGVVMEFGVRWGQNLALFSTFRGMYEPSNFYRKIIGFDTFSGFPTIHEKDGSDEIATAGAYGVTEGYEQYLEQVLAYHETESPNSHIKKFELVKGDACETLPRYLEEYPETIVALAYFDFDIYLPTKQCLEAITPHLTRGTVIGFDELNCRAFPGETLALKEVFGLSRYAIRRSPLSPQTSYIVID